VAVGSADPNQAELGNIAGDGCLGGVDANAAQALDELLLGCDLMLGDQGEDRLLPLTL